MVAMKSFSFFFTGLNSTDTPDGPIQRNPGGVAPHHPRSAFFTSILPLTPIDSSSRINCFRIKILHYVIKGFILKSSYSDEIYREAQIM